MILSFLARNKFGWSIRLHCVQGDSARDGLDHHAFDAGQLICCYLLRSQPGTLHVACTNERACMTDMHSCDCCSPVLLGPPALPWDGALGFIVYREILPVMGLITMLLMLASLYVVTCFAANLGHFT